MDDFHKHLADLLRGQVLDDEVGEFGLSVDNDLMLKSQQAEETFTAACGGFFKPLGSKNKYSGHIA